MSCDRTTDGSSCASSVSSGWRFTCNEGGGDAIGISWLAYPGRRLDHDRSFAITESGDLVAGTLRWRHGEGTLEMSYAQGGGTCTTGELTWSVQRTGWAPDPPS